MALNLYEMDPRIYDEYIDTEIERKNFNKILELIKNIISNKSTEILDVCCGTGIFPRKYLLGLHNVRYYGVDINAAFIKFARQKTNNEKFKFVVDDAVTFKTNKKFDIAIVTSSYHHITDDKKKKFLKNILLHLKPKGILIVYEKIVKKFSNNIEAIDSGTEFYLERIKYMLRTEKLNQNQLFALFNEQYLTSIRREEYKVDFDWFKKDVESSDLKIKKIIKLWPKDNVFKNDKVGDFIFIIGRE